MTQTNFLNPNTPTPNPYKHAGIVPRQLAGYEADYICTHCLAIVPDGVNCRHCNRKKEAAAARLQALIDLKQAEKEQHEEEANTNTEAAGVTKKEPR